MNDWREMAYEDQANWTLHECDDGMVISASFGRKQLRDYLRDCFVAVRRNPRSRYLVVMYCAQAYGAIVMALRLGLIKARAFEALCGWTDSWRKEIETDGEHINRVVKARNS